MDRHALTTLACMLWALALVAAFCSLNQTPGRDHNGQETSPAGRFLALWTWALALLFLAAVGLTAWLAS